MFNPPRHLPLLLGVALWVACGPATAADVDEELSALFASQPKIGDHRSDGDPAFTLGMIGGGRFFGGSLVAVWDRVPPLIKVFGRDGTPVSSFMQRGGGPSEAREVRAVAAAGDSLLLVAVDGGRLTLYDPNGRAAGEFRLSGPPISFAEFCDGTTAVYTPAPREQAGTDWVFLLTLGDGQVGLSALFGDTLSVGDVGLGDSGFVTREGGVVLRHVYGATTSVVRIDCFGQVLDPVEIPGAAVYPRMHREPGGRLATTAVSVGDALRGGLGSIGEFDIVADFIFSTGDPADFRSILYIVRNGVLRGQVMVRGNYRILDSRPGVGLLMMNYDPYPHVFIVPEEELLQVLRRRW